MKQLHLFYSALELTPQRAYSVMKPLTHINLLYQPIFHFQTYKHFFNLNQKFKPIIKGFPSRVLDLRGNPRDMNLFSISQGILPFMHKINLLLIMRIQNLFALTIHMGIFILAQKSLHSIYKSRHNMFSIKPPPLHLNAWTYGLLG